jgi:hypothetical protein
MKITLAFILFSLLLTACDSGPNFAELCEKNSDICNEFEEDTWCKRERIAVGFANLNHRQKPDDLQKFDQLIAYENYATCMGHASKIEHIKLKHKKTMRVNNHIKAKKRIKAISTETKNSEHPYLLHYHWSRYLNEAALSKFLAQEGTESLETPFSQYNLATYYAKRDLDKTLQLLFHALELYQENDKVDPEIFKSISTIFTEQKKPKQVYVWLKVLKLHSPEDETVDDNSLRNYIKTYNLKAEGLDNLAIKTLEKIELGTFKAP